MSEHALWIWLKDHLPIKCHTSRIESDTSAGFPDVHYTWGSVTGTIELKKSRYPNAECPFRTGGMRQSQIDWIRDEIAAGGTVFLLVQVKQRRFLLEGTFASTLNEMSLQEIARRALIEFNCVDDITFSLRQLLAS